jgi:uncharacterized protein (TIGR02588 family)
MLLILVPIIALLLRRSSSAEQRTNGRSEEGAEEAESRTTVTHDRSRSTAEWITLGVSSAVILAVVGLLVYHQLSGGDEPPVIEVQPRLEAVRAAGGAYYLPVEVANGGGATAQDVRVLVSMGTGGTDREASELLIDFLPGGGTASGVVVFRQDPRQRPLEVDVLSYLEP